MESSRVLRFARVLVRPGPLLVLAFLAAAFVLERWVRAIGGPDAIIERFGLGAPLVMVAIQAALAAAPFPSELFAVASAAAYGWAFGSLVAWSGWTIGSMIQYALARRGSRDVALEGRLKWVPGWLARFPIEHPAFLIAVRWLPMGFHFANLAAGSRRIPARRQLWIAALGSIPGAILWGAVGAGVRLL